MSSTAADVHTAVQHIYEEGLPDITFVVTEFAEIYMRLARLRGPGTASLLVEALHDPMFDLKMFKKLFMSLKNCEESFCKSTKDYIKDDGLLAP